MTPVRRLWQRLPARVRRLGRTLLRRERPKAVVPPVGPPVAPHRVPFLDAHAARDEVVTCVVDALRAAGVPATVLPRHGPWPDRVVVRADMARLAWRALAEGLTGPGWACSGAAVRQGAPSPVGRLVPLSAASLDRAARAGAVAVTRVLESHGAGLAGEIGCWVEAWALAAGDEPRPDGSTHEAGTLVGRWAAGTVAYLSPAAWDAATGDGPQPAHPPHLDHPHLFEVTEPIDVVYTWVDGSDPRWRERRDAARVGVNAPLGPAADVESRYVSRDELRYSLRSLAAYAGWVRHIHIVTDGQLPPWLDTTHPRIRVVDHREIFEDVDALPTFNSHAIESRLHHVPGLSDRYLYLNDDVFFGRPVPPEMFFHGNGLARFFLSALPVDVGEVSERDLPVVSAAKQNRALVERAYGRTVTHKYFHAPHPQVRSVLLDMERLFPQEMATVGRSTFRHPQDISVAASLHHHVAYATGRAVPGSLAYRYVDLAAPDAGARLAALLAKRDRDVFCLNDVMSTPEQMQVQAVMVADFLEGYFPAPSPFERSV